MVLWVGFAFGLLAVVEFVLAPQHETSYDSEIIKKEDFDY